MDPRPPPGFGPFTGVRRGPDRGPALLRRAIAGEGGEAADAPREMFIGEALQAEINRERAAIAFRCATTQIFVVLAACLVAATLLMTTWHRLAVYEAALKNCAGV